MIKTMKVACIYFKTAAPTDKLAELFLRFSPQIAILKNEAIFVEIGKASKLYSEVSFMTRSKILLRKFGVTAHIALGTDITDSLAFARFGVYSIDLLPLTALYDFVDPFKRDETLNKPIHNLIASFRDLGIKNIKDFKKIPVQDLIARFGVLGRFVYYRVHMQDFISWPYWIAEEIILERKEFPYFEFYGELDPILFELKSQLDRVFARLFARRKRASRMEVIVQCEKNSVHAHYLRKFDFEFFTPQHTTKGTLRIIKERLSRDFEKNHVKSPIESIQIKVTKAMEFEGGQKNIFNNDEEKFEQIASLHNQLIEILGKENVFQAELTEDRRPERSWKKYFGQPHLPLATNPDILEAIPDRPTYLCRQPIKIEVTAGYIHINKKKYKITYWDNQIEKINGGWFEKFDAKIENVFDRNYCFVEIEGNQKLSIFETRDRCFYLHGYYG